MSSAAPIAATVLTGFLGAGKTTLLNELLHGSHGLRIAVIVNEFGAVGVDGALVAGGEQFVELDNGCLCCALNADLDRTLRELMGRGGFEHVVVETTGMADPLPVAWSFTRPELSQYYRVDAIVTLVDAHNLQRAMAAAQEPTTQIARADIIVLGKLDLVSDDGAAAEAIVRQHNGVATLLRRRLGEPLPLEVLLSHAPRAETRRSALAQGGHHRASFESWAFETAATIDERVLEDVLYEVPDAVYRVKGLLHTSAPWGWTLVNMVAGRMDVRPLQPSRPPAKSGLVFIGPQLDRAQLATLCARLVP